MLLGRHGLLAHLLLLGFGLSFGLRSLEDEMITREPSVVIAGIGDSGTTAVTVALKDMGMEQCGNRDQFLEPPWGHFGRENRIKSFLNVTKGEFSRDAFSRDTLAYLEAQSWMLSVAHQDYYCIVQQRAAAHLPFRKGTRDIKWGFKEPHYAWLLPIMDEAFRNRTKYLLIARDPRDICSNLMQDQFGLYGAAQDIDNCYEWWARFWSRLLETYENEPRFAIVRIEDLVLPDPHHSMKSLGTMGCVVEHVGMKADFADLQKAVMAMQTGPGSVSTLELFGTAQDSQGPWQKPQRVNWQQAENQVKKFHNHTGAYQGHHNGFTEEVRQKLVSEVRNMINPPIVHETMQRLGYDPKQFHLLEPTSRACLCHQKPA